MVTYINFEHNIIYALVIDLLLGFVILRADPYGGNCKAAKDLFGSAELVFARKLHTVVTATGITIPDNRNEFRCEGPGKSKNSLIQQI